MMTRNEIVSTRRVIGWTQRQLATEAGIGLVTVINYEQGRKVRPSTEKAIRTALKRGIDQAAVLIL